MLFSDMTKSHQVPAWQLHAMRLKTPSGHL